jgi:hypothetical protein
MRLKTVRENRALAEQQVECQPEGSEDRRIWETVVQAWTKAEEATKTAQDAVSEAQTRMSLAERGFEMAE